MKEARREGIRLEDALAFVRRAAVRRFVRSLRQLHMGALCEDLYGFHEIHAIHFHHKLNHRSALMTAETVIQLRCCVHAERRRFLIVKRTTAPIPSSLLFQRNILGDDLFKSDARAKLVQPCIR